MQLVTIQIDQAAVGEIIDVGLAAQEVLQALGHLEGALIQRFKGVGVKAVHF